MPVERLVARDGDRELVCADGRWYWDVRVVEPERANGSHGTGRVTRRRCLGALGSDEAALREWRRKND